MFEDFFDSSVSWGLSRAVADSTAQNLTSDGVIT